MKKLALFVTTMITAVLCFAETKDYKSIVPEKYVAELEKNGLVRLIHENSNDATRYLMPENDFAETIEKDFVEKKAGNFPFICESLYLIDKKEYAKKGDISSLNIQTVSEAMRSISKMQGMSYYSTTRKRRLVLYKNAYTLEGPVGKIQVADRNTGNADGLKNWILFDDASFGDLKCELDYRQNDSTFYMSYRTIEDIKVLMVKPVAAGDLLVHALFIDCGEHFLIYIVSDVDSMKFPGIKKQMEESLISRMDALSSWLGEQF